MLDELEFMRNLQVAEPQIAAGQVVPHEEVQQTVRPFEMFSAAKSDEANCS
jgi:hypothetical protein